MSEASIDGQSRGMSQWRLNSALNSKEWLGSDFVALTGAPSSVFRRASVGFGVGFVCMCGGLVVFVGRLLGGPVLHMRLRQLRLQFRAVVESETT